MKKLALLVGIVALPMFGLTGCGPSKPDPRDNPDFNHASAANPGAVKMGPANVKGAPKAKK